VLGKLVVGGSMECDLKVLLTILDAYPELVKLRGWDALRYCNDLRSMSSDKYGYILRHSVRINHAGRVTLLDLHSCSLEGSVDIIPLRALTKLWRLDLSSNRLSGELPQNLGTSQSCPELHQLVINNNKNISTRIATEFLQKPMLELDIIACGTHIKHCYLVGVSFPSEVVGWLMKSMPEFQQHGSDRVQPEVRNSGMLLISPPPLLTSSPPLSSPPLSSPHLLSSPPHLLLRTSSPPHLLSSSPHLFSLR
jgi:hypothetical protein